MSAADESSVRAVWVLSIDTRNSAISDRRSFMLLTTGLFVASFSDLHPPTKNDDAANTRTHANWFRIRAPFEPISCFAERGNTRHRDGENFRFECKSVAAQSTINRRLNPTAAFFE